MKLFVLIVYIHKDKTKQVGQIRLLLLIELYI